MASHDVVLSKEQQFELRRIAQSRSLPAGYVFRARLPDAGRGCTLQHHQATTADHSTDHQSLETAFPCLRNQRSGYLSSRADGSGTDSGTASQDSCGYPEKAQEWLY